MWLNDADRHEAAQHERQVQSMTWMMLPMMDVASLVERTPEADCRRTAEHQRSIQVGAGDRSPSVMTRLAAWLKRHMAGLLRQREASRAAGGW